MANGPTGGPVTVNRLKQAEISANGVRKIIVIQSLNKIIFLAALADIFTCYKQKLTQL